MAISLRLPRVMWLIAVLVVGGCSIETNRLPTISYNGNCRGVGIEGNVTGDPSDSRVTWLVSRNGARRDIVWPIGDSARFTPRLEVLDERGAVVFRDGDPVTGGCVTGPGTDGPLLIAAGF